MSTGDRKCEAVWVRANGVKGRGICIGVCYRSPSANDEENDALLNMIRSVAEKEKSLLLVGDFNYPRINWEELDVSGDGEAFLDIIEDNFLCQHVTQATRGTNILDLVISSEEELVSKLSIGPSIGGSDHSSVEFLLNLELHGREQPSLGLDYRKADIAAISKELGGIDWNERFREKDANGMWMEFVMVMEQLKDKYVPRFKGSRRRKQKWMDYRACRAVKKNTRHGKGILILRNIRAMLSSKGSATRRLQS